MGGRWIVRAMALPVVTLAVASLARADVTDAPQADTSYMDSTIGGAARGHREAGTDPALDADMRKRIQDILKDAPVAVDLFATLKVGLVSNQERLTCPKTVPHYISGKKAVVQFAKHAKNNGPCTVSLYFGHGTGGPDINKDVLDEVKAELSSLGNTPATPTSGQIGFSSCWAKQYGAAVPAGYGTSYQWDNDTISDVKALTGDIAAKKNQIINSLLTLCELCDFDVEVHLYFGQMVSKPGTTNADGFSSWR